MVALVIGLFIAGLDMSVVNVMLPTLADTFGVPVTGVAIVVTGYVAAMAATLLFFGRWVDLWRAESVFAMGLLVFSLSSFLCAMSTRFEMLLAARVIQGLGGAMSAAASGAVVMRRFPPNRIGSVMGVMMMALGLGNASGPPIGGWLLQQVAWHWIFLVQVPVGLLGAALMGLGGPPVVAESERHGADWRKRLDWQGALWCMAGFPLLLTGLGRLAAGHWRAPETLLFLAAAIFCVAGFMRSQRRHSDPLLRFDVFRNPDVTAAVAAKGTLQMTMQGWVMVFPFFLERGVGFSTARIGSVLMVLSMAMLVTTPSVGRLVDRRSPWKILGVALIFVAAAIGGGLVLDPRQPGGLLWVVMVFFGLGQAAFLVTTSVVIVKAAPKGSEGMYSALNTVIMPVGAALGSTLFSGLYAAGAADGTPHLGFSAALWGMLAVVVVLAGGLACRRSLTGIR